MTAQAGSASSSLWQQRAVLRRQMRQTRRAISFSEKQVAARQLAAQLQRTWLLPPRSRIGVYLAMPEEISLQRVIPMATRRGCQLFTPYVSSRRLRQMFFTAFAASHVLQRNHYGIAESRNHRRIDARSLDVVLVPTVAFDANGHRIGMGAGFYDRHFAFRQRSRWRRPLLIGVAFAQQQTAAVPHAAHDVPLDAIVTPRGTFGTRYNHLR